MPSTCERLGEEFHGEHQTHSCPQEHEKVTEDSQDTAPTGKPGSKAGPPSRRTLHPLRLPRQVEGTVMHASKDYV